MREVLRVGHEAKDLGQTCVDCNGLRVGFHNPSPLLPGGSSPSVMRVLTASRSASSRSRSEEHTSELQSPCNLVCRLLLEKKKKKIYKCTQAITISISHLN